MILKIETRIGLFLFTCKSFTVSFYISETKLSVTMSSSSTDHGFPLADPKFDPWDNQAIKDYYKKKEAEGVLSDDPGVEDEIEAEAKQVVIEWEIAMGRKATQEERDKVMTKIRRIRAGAWLEGIKKELAGQTTAPIAYFNRLAEENERSIAFVSHRMVGMAHERKKLAEEMRELQDTNGRLATLLKQREDENFELQDKNYELGENNIKIQQVADRLREDLEKAAKDAKQNEEMAVNALKQCEENRTDLKDENTKLAEENAEAKDEIERLRAELAKAKEKAGKDEEAANDALDGCKEDKLKTEDENAKLKEEIKKLKEEEHRLRDELAKAIEKAEKDEKASKDKIKDLEEQLQRCRDDLTGAMNDLQDDREAYKKLVYDQDDLTIKYNHLKIDFDKLKEENDKKDKNPTPVNHDCWDTAKILKELKEAKKKDKDISEEIDNLINSWLRRVADVNDRREFYNAMDDLQKLFRELQDRIRAIYTRLGFDGTKSTAEQVLTHLEAELDKQPREDMKSRLYTLSLAMELQLEHTRLHTEKLRTETLEMQLDLKKPDEDKAMELRMEYGIYEEEELERRVDSRTQTYRVHRQALLGHMFNAANDLKVAAAGCPHNATRRRINEICDKNLDPMSLPPPKVQPSRMSR